MDKDKHRVTYLKDYRPLEFEAFRVELVFDLFEEFVNVAAKLFIRKTEQDKSMLFLSGKNLHLTSLSLDGNELDSGEFKVSEEGLEIFDVPDSFILEIGTRLTPQHNKALDGLYKSSGTFCTQCEAEGFRKITYFPDRPDNLAVYTTTIIGDKDKYPVMLANGNLVEQKKLSNNRHLARWDDPFAKPSYLFAMVAGDLARLSDTFITRSMKKISLEIYVQRHNADKCDHALESLKKAMRWDEERFGLEYDLNQYMIVAVDDFNMGAMENKGLNIFNSKYVLARPETATDSDYEAIEAVIGHEYFHNWTGNRVTCRDWFQLSLKEGLTVFRDQEFTADMTSSAVKRIKDVELLRQVQFPEDSGPMAHPVRPDSYLEINNFYTVTVYEKGAEIIRMIQTILGKETFSKGLLLYLDRFDGHAATTDDFVNAMAEAGNVDLTQFKLWYSQAGTPELHVHSRYDPDRQLYVLQVRQLCPPTPGQKEKKSMHIPLAMALLDNKGKELPLILKDHETDPPPPAMILDVRQEFEEFVFTAVERQPVPSLLRNFSAPVKVVYDYSDDDLYFLLGRDQDPFCRWEAGQQLATRILLQLVRSYQVGENLDLPKKFSAIMKEILQDNLFSDRTYQAQLLTLPTEAYISEQLEVIDVEAIHAARTFVLQKLAADLHGELLQVYRSLQHERSYEYNREQVGRRRLKNLCLRYLLELEDEQVSDLAKRQFETADNMTDCISALRAIVHTDKYEKEEVLLAFDEKWGKDVLVMDKWLEIQATAPHQKVLEDIKRLMSHKVFSLANPNRVRALIGSYSRGNPVGFHIDSGAGYEFVADIVMKLDRDNPQIAARLLGALSRWHRYDESRQKLMKDQLGRVLAQPGLSRDVFEVGTKSLGQ